MKTAITKRPLLGILIVLISLFSLVFIAIFINVTNINSRVLKLDTDNCQNLTLLNWMQNNFLHNESYVAADNTILIKELLDDYPANLIGQVPYLSSFYPTLNLVNTFIETSTINPTGSNLPQQISIDIEIDNLKLKKTQVINMKLALQNVNCYVNLAASNGNDTVNITGSLSEEEFAQEVPDRFFNLVQALRNNKGFNYIYFPPETDNTALNLLKDGIDILSSATIAKVQIQKPENQLNIFRIATVELAKQDFVDTISIYYDPLKDNLVFNISELNLFIFKYLKQADEILSLNCRDCSLAPVSKNFSLPASYAPQVVNTNITGGGQLNSQVVAQLQKLTNAAEMQGISISIISAYRSYANQVSTFNYWVTREMATGLSRSAAEVKANNYSARAGQSEHQLGTTVDLRCNTCNSFDNSVNNLKMYDYLKKNAHLYGFVISYPDDKKELTGYNSEAWHIRYIGTENATKLYDLHYLADDNEQYLTAYLITYNLY